MNGGHRHTLHSDRTGSSFTRIRFLYQRSYSSVPFLGNQNRFKPVLYPHTVKLVSRRNSQKNNTQFILVITVKYDESIPTLESLIYVRRFSVLYCTAQVQAHFTVRYKSWLRERQASGLRPDGASRLNLKIPTQYKFEVFIFGKEHNWRFGKWRWTFDHLYS